MGSPSGTWSYVSNLSHYTGLSCVDSVDVISLQLHLHQLLSISKHLDLANPITLIPWMLLSLSKQGKSKSLEMQIRFCFWPLCPCFKDPKVRSFWWNDFLQHGPSIALSGSLSFLAFLTSIVCWNLLYSPHGLHPSLSCLSNAIHPAFGKASQVIFNRPDLLVHSPMESNTYSSNISSRFIAKYAWWFS